MISYKNLSPETYLNVDRLLFSMTKEGLAGLQDTYQSLLGLDEKEVYALAALSDHGVRAGKIYETGVQYFGEFEKRLHKLKSTLKHLSETGKEQSKFLDPRAVAGIKNGVRKQIVFLLHELTYDAGLIHHVLESFTQMEGIDEDALDTSTKALVQVLFEKKDGVANMKKRLERLELQIREKKKEMMALGERGGHEQAEKGLAKLYAIEEDILSKEQHEENMLRDLLAISERSKEELKGLLGNIDYVQTILSNAVATLHDFARVADPSDDGSVDTFYKQADSLFETLRSDIDLAIASVQKVHGVLKKMHKHDHLVFALQIKLGKKNDRELEDLKKAIRLTRQMNVVKFGLTGL